MRRRIFTLSLAGGLRSVPAACMMLMLLLVLAIPADADAQRPRPGAGRMGTLLGPPAPGVGARAGYDFDEDTWSVGAQARIPVGPRGRVELVPSGDVFFSADRTDWQLNLDAALRLGPLYGGGGLGVLNRDFTDEGEAATSAGLNLFTGLQLPGIRLPVRPFTEVRWTLVENTAAFRLVVGANVPLGDRRARRSPPSRVPAGAERGSPTETHCTGAETEFK